MQKLTLNQSLQQRLSPQQIQFIKLLQIPTSELSARVEEELEINPALEEGLDISEKSMEDTYGEGGNEDDFDEFSEFDNIEGFNGGNVDVKDYLNQDEYSGYKMAGDGWDEEEKKLDTCDFDGYANRVVNATARLFAFKRTSNENWRTANWEY